MNVKIIITAACLFVLYPVFDSVAQKPTKEIEIGAGIGTIPELVDIYYDVFTSLFSLGSVETETNATGGLSLGYKSRISERFALGGTYVFEHFDKTFSRNGSQIGTGDVNWHAFMGSMDYYWVNNPSFGLFSGAGLGFALYSEKQRNRNSGEEDSDSSITLAFQLDLLGVDFGREFNVALAFGAGFEGILALRLGYRF